MNGKKFPWGKVIDRFEYNFDGTILEVVKYHPKKYDGTEGYSLDEMFHCEEISGSFGSIQHLLISWIVYKNLGLNEHSLANGIARALKITE